MTRNKGAHATQRGTFEAFATIQRVGVLNETNIVLCDAIDERTGSGELTEGQLIMIAIIKDIEKVGIEGMEVIKIGEVGDDLSELIVEQLLRELDFAHIEIADATYCIALVHDRRSLSLGLGKYIVNECRAGWDNCEILEVV